VVDFDLTRNELTRLGPPDAQRLRTRAVQLERDSLEIEDDVGRVLDDTGDRRELVQHAFDPHGGDRGALDRREQRTAKAVADRRAETTLERLRGELAVSLRQRIGIRDK